MSDESDPQKPGTILTPSNTFSDGYRERIPPGLVGSRGIYQLGYVGSPVPQLLGRDMVVDSVSITQTTEPFKYQYTDVMSIPGEPPSEIEITRRLWSRKFQMVTLASLPVEVPESRMDQMIYEARTKCEAALGVIVAALDERIVDRRIGEYIEVESGGEIYNIDITSSMRSFHPDIVSVDADGLAGNASGATHDPLVRSAFRFYLLGVEHRLSEIGYVLLASTADMLAGGKNKLNAYDLRAALLAAGADEGTWPVSRVKKITETRGKLIHNGMLESKDMYSSWYDLEEVVRILLRHRVSVSSAWPSRVPMYEGPMLAAETEFDEEEYPAWVIRGTE